MRSSRTDVTRLLVDAAMQILHHDRDESKRETQWEMDRLTEKFKEILREYQTPEYVAWQAMIQRCENTKAKFYHRYGGRGISVCERWRNSFSSSRRFKRGLKWG